MSHARDMLILNSDKDVQQVGLTNSSPALTRVLTTGLLFPDHTPVSLAPRQQSWTVGGGQQTGQQSGPEERDQVAGNCMTNDDIEIFLVEFSTSTRPTWWTLWNILE